MKHISFFCKVLCSSSVWSSSWCWCQWWFSLSLLLVAESRFPTTTAPQYYWADWRQGWTLLYYHHLKILLLSVYQRPDSEAIIFVLTPTHQINKNNTNLEINRQKLNSKLFSLFEAIKACGWWSWEFYWMKYFRFYLKRFCQEPINYRDWILLGLNFNLFLREKLCKYFVLIYVKVYVYLIPVFSVLISVDLWAVIFDAGVVTLYWDADMGLQWHGVSSRHWSQDRQCLKTISLQTQDIMRLGWVMAVVRNWFFTILHSMESSWKLSNRSGMNSQDSEVRRSGASVRVASNEIPQSMEK